MYLLNIELMRHISERLNIAESKPDYSLYIKRKNKKGSHEEAPFFMHGVKDISIDRRYNMAADELRVTFDNKDGMLSPDYSPAKEYKGVRNLPKSGFKEVLVPFNEIGISLGYGDELRRIFTGQIANVSISESQRTIKIECKNMFRKLLKPIDPKTKKVLLYQDMAAGEIIKSLIKEAGLDEKGYDINTETLAGKEYTIPKAEFQIGMSYADAIQSILDTMSHRIYAGRNGIITVKKLELYAQTDFHLWDIDDYVNMSSGEYSIDPQFIRNRVIVKSGSGWQAFEDPFLMDYCNQETISCGIEVPWAQTEDHRWAVADKFFLDMRRKLRKITVAVKGNPSLDIGDLVRVTGLVSTANAKYMVIGIQSTFNSSGYVDVIELEYTQHGNGHLCNIAEGQYEDVEDSVAGGTMFPVMTTKRNELLKSALRWNGVPYQWGGDVAHNKGDYGFDCSHFIYAVLKQNNLQDTYMVSKALYKECIAIKEEELQIGDLVFYSDSQSPEDIRHVGMYMADGKVISALGNSSVTSEGAARKMGKSVQIHRINWDKGVRFYAKVKGI